ncbi:MAG: PP2C family protein-serine/threonine phosphatase, partial [Terriglobia bacterium]
CRPARTVSGDYYDYGMADAGKMLFAIGDISGKGISAALLMATIQSILRSQVYAMRLSGELGQLNLGELAARVNRQLCATTSQEKYSTLFLGLYDDRTRRLTYTNAGHLPPVVLGSGRTRQLGVGGPVVGLFRDLRYEQASVQLEPGNMLVAFTDGLTEVENSYEEEYGIPRLVAFLERTADNSHPERVIDAVLAELQQWAPGREPVDDCTMLVACVR